VETTLGPGDVLFIPSGWLHATESLDLNFGLSFWTDAVYHERDLLEPLEAECAAQRQALEGWTDAEVEEARGEGRSPPTARPAAQTRRMKELMWAAIVRLVEGAARIGAGFESPVGAAAGARAVRRREAAAHDATFGLATFLERFRDAAGVCGETEADRSAYRAGEWGARPAAGEEVGTFPPNLGNGDPALFAGIGEDDFARAGLGCLRPGPLIAKLEDIDAGLRANHTASPGYYSDYYPARRLVWSQIEGMVLGLLGSHQACAFFNEARERLESLGRDRPGPVGAPAGADGPEALPAALRGEALSSRSEGGGTGGPRRRRRRRKEL
jgi:hypothetical protein